MKKILKKVWAFFIWYHEGLIKFDESLKDMDPKTKDRFYRSMFGK